MASVYLAVDEKLGREVAVKVLHTHLTNNKDIRQRFQGEARAISSIDHPNIIKIYDYSGERSDSLWIVMEVLSGSTLAKFNQGFPAGHMDAFLGTIIIQEIAQALKFAHSKGIVHRDIKPENVMLLKSGRLKLMDFGISKDMRAGQMTVTGTFMGSPSYMSPEQIRGEDVDQRSDLYSLGIVHYELLTGAVPFVGSSTPEVIAKIMAGKYLPARILNNRIPPEIHQLIERSISSAPETRHQTAQQLITQADRIMQSFGFEESHVELERYFRDQMAFEAKVRDLERSLMRTKVNSPPSIPARMRAKAVTSVRRTYPPTAVQVPKPPPPRPSMQRRAAPVDRSGTTNHRPSRLTPPKRKQNHVAKRHFRQGPRRQTPRQTPRHATIQPQTKFSNLVLGLLAIAILSAAVIWLATLVSERSRQPRVEETKAVQERGTLVLRVPGNASAYIDGKLIKPTALDGPITLSAGPHKVTVRRPGFLSQTKSIVIEPGTLHRLAIDLEPETHGLSLSIAVNVAPTTFLITRLHPSRFQRTITLKSTTASIKLPKGRYQIKASHGSKTETRYFSLSQSGESLRFTFDGVSQ